MNKTPSPGPGTRLPVSLLGCDVVLLAQGELERGQLTTQRLPVTLLREEAWGTGTMGTWVPDLALNLPGEGVLVQL